MDEIKVVPYIPDEDYDNPAMVVDFYEFTMANCLFLHGFKDTTLPGLNPGTAFETVELECRRGKWNS